LVKLEYNLAARLSKKGLSAHKRKLNARSALTAITQSIIPAIVVHVLADTVTLPFEGGLLGGFRSANSKPVELICCSSQRSRSLSLGPSQQLLCF
jgi:hypothetical protein